MAVLFRLLSFILEISVLEHRKVNHFILVNYIAHLKLA